MKSTLFGFVFVGISLRVIKGNITASMKSSKMSRPAGKAQVNRLSAIPDHESTLESPAKIKILMPESQPGDPDS